MAGTSHWSLSAEPHETGFRCEVACRVKEPPPRLASTYRLRAGSLKITSESVDHPMLESLSGVLPDGRGRWVVRPLPVAGAPTRAAAREPDVVELSPLCPRTLAGPTTIRWAYWIGLAD